MRAARSSTSFKICSATLPGMDRLIGIKPIGSKQDRVVARSSKFESGSVYLPKARPLYGAILSASLGIDPEPVQRSVLEYPKDDRFSAYLD